MPASVVVVGVLMLSSLLSVGYLLPIVARGFFLPPPDAAGQRRHEIEEAPIACLIALCCTALLCIVLFFLAGRIETLLEAIAARPENVRLTHDADPQRKAPTGWTILATSTGWSTASTSSAPCCWRSTCSCPSTGRFAIEHVFGFYGLFGFVACVALVLIAKQLRRVLMRPEDYYDR